MIGAVELQPGTLVDGWQIVRALRTGGFGAVHHAEQHGKAFAIKVAVHREQSGDTGKTHTRALQEVSLLLTLDHPNIIKPRGFGYLPDGRVYCVLEYVDGWTLGEWKERTFPTFREVCSVFAKIAGAVEYMHKRKAKVFHRDLKLANVMIRSSNGEPVIIDLGCATYENAEELTTTPLGPGTDRYRSYEAWDFYYQQGRKHGGRYPFKVTDELFAVGVMLYEMLTAPLPSREPPRLDFSDRVGDLPAARDVNPRVPEALSALVEDLLAHDPAQRPVNFKALRRRLEELAKHPGPEYAAEVHPPSVQRQPPPGDGAQAAGLAAQGKQGWRKVLALADKQAARFRGRLQSAPSRQHRRRPLALAATVGAVAVAAAGAAWLTHGERPGPVSAPALKEATAPPVPTAPALPPEKFPPVSSPAPATAPKEGSTVKPKPPDAPKSSRSARATKAPPAQSDPGFPAWCKALPLAVAMATEGCASVRTKAEPFECPPGAQEAMEKLGWIRVPGKPDADLAVRLDERGGERGLWTFTLGAPVTGRIEGARFWEVPEGGALLYGRAYKTDGVSGDPLGTLFVIYDHVEIPGKGKYPVCVVSTPARIQELKDDKATTGNNVGGRPVTSWEPPRY
ncbi:serine/threonine protein kinase [Hyalangium rubrum]|uniref:non-specific serine/threonine protein kinase n=1 Tax=Hyalangium rubrum TaxID=3103134 RepID=A0ABU5HEW0_9BACT|nr:protein kinase [Hyalangium sp. s54d21]MDY7231896.1 protein kinase [Hyalangium sp. s54d21]